MISSYERQPEGIAKMETQGMFDSSPVERQLIEDVRSQLNSGTKSVTISGDLAVKARPEIIAEIRRLCKLNGATVDVRT